MWRSTSTACNAVQRHQAAIEVDVNEAWSLDEALEALPQLAELGVGFCEQPLAARDEGGTTLKERSPIPIYVDEDCHRLGDVAACAEIAHGINIKLAKSRVASAKRCAWPTPPAHSGSV